MLELIDCNNCKALCCRLQPIIRTEDFDKLLSYLKVTIEEFIRVYTLHTRYLKRKIIDNKDYCIFVTSDYKCSIYSVRPRDCRTYTCNNWDKKDFKRFSTSTFSDHVDKIIEPRVNISHCQDCIKNMSCIYIKENNNYNANFTF